MEKKTFAQSGQTKKHCSSYFISMQRKLKTKFKFLSTGGRYIVILTEECIPVLVYSVLKQVNEIHCPSTKW